MRRRYATDPTPEMREQARAELDRPSVHGRDPHHTRTNRTYFTLGWLGGLLKDLIEVDDPQIARRVAFARAVYDAYREAL